MYNMLYITESTALYYDEMLSMNLMTLYNVVCMSDTYHIKHTLELVSIFYLLALVSCSAFHFTVVVHTHYIHGISFGHRSQTGTVNNQLVNILEQLAVKQPNISLEKLVATKDGARRG